MQAIYSVIGFKLKLEQIYGPAAKADPQKTSHKIEVIASTSSSFRLLDIGREFWNALVAAPDWHSSYLIHIKRPHATFNKSNSSNSKSPKTSPFL